MEKCKRCYSYAVNHHCRGRYGSDPDLCDVRYWRKRAEACGTPEAAPVRKNCGLVHSPADTCEELFRVKDAPTDPTSEVFTAQEWMELHMESAAAHRDVMTALTRLPNAHHPKPFGGIVDVKERRLAIHLDNVEVLEATQHAHQTLLKYSPFANPDNVLTS